MASAVSTGRDRRAKARASELATSNTDVVWGTRRSSSSSSGNKKVTFLRPLKKKEVGEAEDWLGGGGSDS